MAEENLFTGTEQATNIETPVIEPVPVEQVANNTQDEVKPNIEYNLSDETRAKIKGALTDEDILDINSLSKDFGLDNAKYNELALKQANKKMQIEKENYEREIGKLGDKASEINANIVDKLKDLGHEKEQIKNIMSGMKNAEAVLFINQLINENKTLYPTNTPVSNGLSKDDLKDKIIKTNNPEEKLALLTEYNRMK